MPLLRTAFVCQIFKTYFALSLGSDATIKFTIGIKNKNLFTPTSFKRLKPSDIDTGNRIMSFQIKLKYSIRVILDKIAIINPLKNIKRQKIQTSFIDDLPVKSKIFLKGVIIYFIFF